MKKRIIVVGGVAGGASAAAKARRMNEDAAIVIYEKGPYVSYGNCGIPYYVGGDIPQRDDLFLVTPQKFWDRYRIDVKVNHEVVSIDREKSVVTVRNAAGMFADRYDRLVLATGGEPVRPPFPGIEANGVFSLWTIPDGDRIMAAAQTLPLGAPVVVVGGGFIGLEMAEALQQRGFCVTIVEKMDQLLPPMDKEIADFAVAELERVGMQVRLNSGVAGFNSVDGQLQEIVLDDGGILPAALAVVSIGVRPQTQLAAAAGLQIGSTGAIAVDRYLRTSDPKIFAAGDVVESYHRSSQRQVRVPLAGPANKQGRTAGWNAAVELLDREEELQTFPGVLGTSIVRIVEQAFAQTGLSEKAARLQGLSVQASHTFSPSHAEYYPGGRTILLKLIAERGSGRLLGAQAVGAAGADKRIDVLAVAIAAGMTVFDLEHLDLAYAPPFSSAKDPVNIAGMAAANSIRGQYSVLSWPEVEKIGADFELVDVRTIEEFNRGHIPGARLFPIDSLRDTSDQLAKDKPIVVYCAVGQRAYTAVRILRQNGFENVFSLSGGWQLWSKQIEIPADEVQR